MSPGLIANLIDAVFLILGKSGKFLNARGNRICFIFEWICLIYWFFTDINRGLYAQAISVVVSFLIAIYGFRRWGKMKMEEKDEMDITKTS